MVHGHRGVMTFYVHFLNEVRNSLTIGQIYSHQFGFNYVYIYIVSGDSALLLISSLRAARAFLLDLDCIIGHTQTFVFWNKCLEHGSQPF